MSHDEKPITFPTAADMPDKVMSLASMLWNRTGSWRYLKPRYRDQVPPCNEGCPAGNDIERFLRLAEEKRYGEAWRVLKEENPLARVTGRVCFHPCENACNRGKYDRPLSIQALERFCADQAKSGDRPEALRESTGKKVAVVGSGPAGLTAAYHLARMGHAVNVFDEQDLPGGVLRIGIPAYRLPRKVLDREIEDIEDLGVQFHMRTRLGKDLTLDQLRREHDAVFLGPGVHQSRAMNVPGQDAPAVMPGLAMLRTLNTGGNLQLGEKVAVIGGGNTAIDAARAAVRLGAKVTLLYRRGKAEMPAHPEEVEAAAKEGVSMRLLCAPVEVIVDGGVASGLRCVKMELGEPDESGRRSPVAVEGSEFTVETDTILTAIGESADFDFAPGDLTRDGDDLAVDPWGRTSIEGVFAGGDAASVKHTVVDAIGDGKRAAISIDRYLSGQAVEQPFPSIGRGGVSIGRYLDRDRTHRNIDASTVASFESLNTNYFEEQMRARMPRLSPERAAIGFGEVNLGFDEDTALAEAARCFHCGNCTMCENCFVLCPDVSISHKEDGAFGYDIAFDYCKGCGICVHECPRSAMVMEEDK